MSEPSSSYYQKYWNKNLPGQEFSLPPEWTQENFNYHLNFFKQFIGKNVLDIGSGPKAEFSKLLLSSTSIIKKIEALELSCKSQTINPKLNLSQGSAESLPYKDSSFDTVFMIEVIEHLLDIDQVLDEIYRVLKPNAYLCITTTDFNLLKKIIIAGLFWDRFFYPNNPHIRFFTKSTLVDICSKHQLKLVDYKWNRSYFGLMPKGQMIVLQKI